MGVGVRVPEESKDPPGEGHQDISNKQNAPGGRVSQRGSGTPAQRLSAGQSRAGHSTTPWDSRLGLRPGSLVVSWASVGPSLPPGAVGSSHRLGWCWEWEAGRWLWTQPTAHRLGLLKSGQKLGHTQPRLWYLPRRGQRGAGLCASNPSSFAAGASGPSWTPHGSSLRTPASGRSVGCTGTGLWQTHVPQCCCMHALDQRHTSPGASQGMCTPDPGSTQNNTDNMKST